MLKWFEKIADDFCEEQAVEDRTSVETVKEKFYIDFIEQFLCSLPTLLFKLLIEKGARHIVEPQPPLYEQPFDTNWEEKQRKWEKFIAERECQILLEQINRTTRDF